MSGSIQDILDNFINELYKDGTVDRWKREKAGPTKVPTQVAAPQNGKITAVDLGPEHGRAR
jgi:hypothetical protein